MIEVGQHYWHPKGDAYKVLGLPSGKFSDVWVDAVYYTSLTTGKYYTTSLERFERRFGRIPIEDAESYAWQDLVIFSKKYAEKLALKQNNSDVCNPDWDLP